MNRTALILLPALAFATPALAFGPPDAHHVERLGAHLEDVGATEAQRGTIRGLIETTLPTLKSLGEERRALREAMVEVFLAPTVDRSAAESVRVQAIDLADRASSALLDLVVDVANVLSPEQRKALHSLHEARHEAHRGEYGPHEGWRRPR